MSQSRDDGEDAACSMHGRGGDVNGKIDKIDSIFHACYVYRSVLALDACPACRRDLSDMLAERDLSACEYADRVAPPRRLYLAPSADVAALLSEDPSQRRDAVTLVMMYSEAETAALARWLDPGQWRTPQELAPEGCPPRAPWLVQL
jgi:hypothetical protein